MKIYPVQTLERCRFFDKYPVFLIYRGVRIYCGADGVKSYSEDLHDRSVCGRGIVYPCSRRSDGKCGLFLYTHLFRICVFCSAYRGCDYDQCQFYQYRCDRHGKCNHPVVGVLLEDGSYFILGKDVGQRYAESI